MNSKAASVISQMIKEGLIPETGTFQITEDLLNENVKIHQKLYPPKDGIELKPSHARFFKKMAGLNMMNLNEARESNVTAREVKPAIKAGFVYFITNPAFSGFVKVGITTDVTKRLASYQTCDPHRNYKIEHYLFVENRREIETEILAIHGIPSHGEWVSTDKMDSIISLLETRNVW